MLKFKIEDKEYKLPEVLTIDHYSKIYKVKDLFSDEYFAAKLLNLVTDAPVEKLFEMDFEEINFLAMHVLNLIPKETPKFSDRFELDGVHYGFFPNWKEISYAEFVDMDTISTKKPEELLNLLHILAAIMYRPIISQKSEHDFEIEKYNVKTMTDRAELFKKKLNVNYILGAQFFFIKFANRYFGYIHLSSMKKVSIWMKIKILWNLRHLIISQIFKKRSVGSSSQTELLEMILRNTNMSMNEKL